MVRLEEVELGMFDAIHRELLEPLAPDRSRDDWMRIVDYPWRPDRAHRGYALFVGSEPVAFMGMIFAQRPLSDGRRERVCNITSWVAREPYQSESSLLVLQLRRYRDWTLTNLSATEQAYRVFTRLGFEVLETHRVILYPNPAWAIHDPFEGEVSNRSSRLQAILDDRDLELCRSHGSLVRHAVIRDGGDYAYVAYTVGRRRRLRTINMHYISNPALFLRGRSSMHRFWFRHHGAFTAACDARLLAGRDLDFARPVRLPVPRLFRSDSVEPVEIDSLYSEIVLLDLN